MLDYAKFSSGQFRKFENKFDLEKAINEILEVMNFKADSLGIKLLLHLENFRLTSSS